MIEAKQLYRLGDMVNLSDISFLPKGRKYKIICLGYNRGHNSWTYLVDYISVGYCTTLEWLKRTHEKVQYLPELENSVESFVHIPEKRDLDKNTIIGKLADYLDEMHGGLNYL
jgi:hypothetical protein